MSIAKWFGFGGDSKAATGIIDALADAGDRLFTSDEERDRWATVMQSVKQQPKMAQAMVSIISAQSSNPFIAGARSAVIYAVAGIMVYSAIVRDILILCLRLTPEEVPTPAIGVESVLRFAGALFGAL